MAGKKLKIGILTFWWSADNYGQLLQCYGLQKYLRDAGHDAFLIRYNSENDLVRPPFFLCCLKAFNPIKLWRYFEFKRRKFLGEREQASHSRGFDEFRKKYIVQSPRAYDSFAELCAEPPEADCYIVGSDQVWNFGGAPLGRTKNTVHAYFLDFGKAGVKRMSYAASWGRADVPQEFRDEITPLLARFDYVSVREKSGVELCRRCGYNDAEVRCDPTLLLPAEKWRELYRAETDGRHTRDPDRKFLLLYMLGNPCDLDIRHVYRFASEKNLEVVYVTGNGVVDNRKKCFATIPEWLSLVDNAAYVATNSFHCCVFSLIFKKQFGVAPLSGICSGMNARMETLFELFCIKPRWLVDDCSVLDEPLDFPPPEHPAFDVEAIAHG